MYTAAGCTIGASASRTRQLCYYIHRIACYYFPSIVSIPHLYYFFFAPVYLSIWTDTDLWEKKTLTNLLLDRLTTGIPTTYLPIALPFIYRCYHTTYQHR